MAFSVPAIIKSQTTLALRDAARSLMREFRLARIHHASLSKARRYLGLRDLKLHFGCGQNLKPDWVNIDLLSNTADLRLDLRERFPFADNSASIIYSEHFFEHLEYPDEVFKVLHESWRVLAPGGSFNLGIPDFEFAVNSYASRDPEYHGIQKQIYGSFFGEDPRRARWTTRMHLLNFTFRQGQEHKYAYDFETLKQVLEEVGFESIVRRPFDPLLDRPSREWGTMYVVANKPDLPRPV
jgi:predicted SAM-dependent methyltransferase